MDSAVLVRRYLGIVRDDKMMPDQVNKLGHLPPNNRAVAIFRVILWLLPACFTFLSPIAVVPLSQQFGFGYFATFAIWMILSAAFTLATGWFNASLSNRAWTEVNGVAWRAIRFFRIQLMLMGLLLVILVILVAINWSLNPPKFFCMISSLMF